MENLDMACAAIGEELGPQTDENTVTRALGVLEEQGVYACFLNLEAEAAKDKKDKGAERIKKAGIGLLREHPRECPLLPPVAGDRDDWSELKALAEDLDRLLFAHQLLRQALVYARYHAKARGKTEGAEEAP